jgi:hypothetical protein
MATIYTPLPKLLSLHYILFIVWFCRTKQQSGCTAVVASAAAAAAAAAAFHSDCISNRYGYSCRSRTTTQYEDSVHDVPMRRHHGNNFGTSNRLTTAAKSKRDNENDTPQQPGMTEAFRQLEALNSLDDPEEYVPAPEKISIQVAADVDNNVTIIAPSATSISPEQDFVVYRNMMEEVEENEVASAYTEVLDELGGSTLQTDDTYSQVLTELGGASAPRRKASAASNHTELLNSELPTDDTILFLQSNTGATNDELLEDALKEALEEVQLNNPRISENSILNDQEIMREIEDIFEKGNVKLLESLEEIRREQVRIMWRFANFCSFCFRFVQSHMNSTIHRFDALTKMCSNHWRLPMPILNELD